MSIYEQAAERIGCRHSPEFVQRVAAAVWDAYYCCPQCNGTGELPGADIDGAMTPCPAEHVELTNPHNGERRYCRPDRAERRCYWHKASMRMHSEVAHCKPGTVRVFCDVAMAWRLEDECDDFGWVPAPYEGSSE